MPSNGSSLKVIDCEVYGHLVRFVSGRAELEQWWGDDWDDVPYEHNAGTVYDQFAHGFREIAFSTEHQITEPCDGHVNSPWCKDDMIARKVECVRIDDTPVYFGDDWLTLNDLPGVVVRSRG